LLLRARALSCSQILQEKKNKDIPITGADLEELHEGMNEYLLLRKNIKEIIYSFKPYERKYDLMNKNLRFMYDMLALSGALVLYDNFSIAIMAFQKNSELRQLVNRGDSGFGIKSNQLEKVLDSYYSSSNKKELKAILDNVKARREWVDTTKKQDKHLAYLDQLITQSPSVEIVINNNIFKRSSTSLGNLARKGHDTVGKIQESTFNEISKIFGNTIGLVQTRKGILFDNKLVAAELKATLKPLDVILDQTPFRLTANFIPGYFGHVAIWTGTPAELKEVGIWENPIIKPHQEDIIAGKRIIEALRDGVQLNTIEHFMDVDDIAVLRLKSSDKSNRAETMIRAFRQLDKKYDFNFDVETLDKIVCSELAYIVFTHIEWPTEKTLGRNTISPDNVAYLAIGKQAKFDLIKFYYDGVATKNKDFELFQSVIKKNH
jgi:hypothetical protein